MTDIELLPMPEPVAVKYPDSGLRDDEHALRLWAAHGYDTGGEPLFSAEQLREATAPLQAEIEVLRAEVGQEQDYAAGAARRVLMAQIAQRRAEARAERMAEALRELVALGHPRDPATIAARTALRDHDQEVGNGQRVRIVKEAE